MINHVNDFLCHLCSKSQGGVDEVFSILEAKGEEAGPAGEQLERLLFVLHTLVSHKDGAKITKPEAVCQVQAEHRRHLLRSRFKF